MTTKATAYRRREQAQIIQQRIVFERRYEKPIKSALNKQIRPVLDAWNRSGDMGLGNDALVRPQPILDLFLKMYPIVALPFAHRSFDAFKKMYVPNFRTKDAPAEIERTWVERFQQHVMSVGGEHITSITETTRKFVRGIIAQAGEEGWSVQEAATALRKKWSDISEYRAVAISRTEILSASNLGSFTGAQTVASEVGLALDKVWLTSVDGREREWHMLANGQKVDLNEAFIVNGEQMMTPGDSSLGASADNIVQCRCTFYVEPK